MNHIVSQSTKQGTLVSLKRTYGPGVVWWTAVTFLVHHGSCSCLPSSVWCSGSVSEPLCGCHGGTLSSHWNRHSTGDLRTHPHLRVNNNLPCFPRKPALIKEQAHKSNRYQRQLDLRIVLLIRGLCKSCFGTGIFLDTVFIGGNTHYMKHKACQNLRRGNQAPLPTVNSLNVSKPYKDWPRVPAEGG